jgi:hypothetical protein
MLRLLAVGALLFWLARAGAQETEVGLVNGGFEGDEDGDGIADGWQYSSGAAADQLDVTMSLEQGREGGTCQRMSCTRWEDGHAMLCQVGTVRVERGRWYQVSFWARGQDLTSASVALHDTDGWQHCGLWHSFGLRERWRPFRFRFQANHDCYETSRFQIWFSSTGTLWVDEVSFVEVEPPPNPQIIEDIGSKNLIPNSSFECGPDGWMSDACWRLFGEPAETDSVHGSHAMRVAWSRAEAPVYSFDYYEMQRRSYVVPAINSEGWMRVEPDVQYVFSVHLRAEQRVSACRLRAFGPSKQFASRSVELAPAWQRYELAFAATEDLCYVQVEVDCDEAGLDELTFYVDAAQLERGEKATDYEPRRPLEIGVHAANGTGIFPGDDPVAAEIRACNHTDTETSVALEATLTDVFDQIVLKREVVLTLPAHEQRRVLLTPEELPRGFFRVQVGSEQTGARHARLARVPRLELSDSPFGMNHAYAWDEFLKLGQAIGVTWVRDWSLKWDHVEPEQGRFEFAETDYQINRPLGLGMNVLCMFPFPSANWSSTAPEEVPADIGPANRIRTAYAPRDPADLENYVYQCVERYKDRNKVWEVFNESIFTSYSLPRRAGYQAADYIPLLEAVYRGCKRADPNCLVMGGYSTPPSHFDDLHKPFIEHGGLQFCDLYSLHIYPGGAPESIAEELDRITDLMRQHGGQKRMWMTEYAYYADDDPDPVPRRWPQLLESELLQAQWNTRMCVTQLAHGVDRIFYHIWNTRGNRDSGSRIFFEYGGAPRKIAATQAAMAYFLGPRPEFVRAVDLGEETSCYVFRNQAGLEDGKPVAVAVAWHHFDEGALTVPDGTAAFDLVGATLSREDVKLSESAVYLVSDSLSAEQLAEAIER